MNVCLLHVDISVSILLVVFNVPVILDICWIAMEEIVQVFTYNIHCKGFDLLNQGHSSRGI